MYISNFIKIITISAICLTYSFSMQAQTIHAIICGGTNINDIGQGCSASVKLIEDAVDYIAAQTGMNANIVKLVGNNFEKSKIQQAISSLDAQSNDVIWFYSTSHGFNYRDKPSKYNFFLAHPTKIAASPNDLARYGMSLEKEVMGNLLSKNARFTLVMGEACNVVIDIDSPSRYNAMSTNIGKRLKELFLYSEGAVISCSSQYKQASWTDKKDGGIYTNMFINSINEVIMSSQTAKWNSVFEKTKYYVNRFKPNGQEQTPEYELIDTPIKFLRDGDRGDSRKIKSQQSEYVSCSINTYVPTKNNDRKWWQSRRCR
ncbi:MAG: caspase family protein [Chitinophagales bacterium]